MNLKTYCAVSIADALGQIKKDLGPDAVILHTRTFKRGGWFGVGARQMVEITASSSVNVVHPLARKGKAPAGSVIRPGSDLLRRTYGAGAQSPSLAASPVPDNEALTPTTATYQRRRGEPSMQTATATTEGATALRETARIAISQENRDASVSESLLSEIGSIKRLVGHVLQSSGGGAQPAMPEALFDRYLRLIESEVSRELADDIVGAVRDELTQEELADPDIVHQATLRKLASHITVADDARAPGVMDDGRPLTIAMVGPTGVGKTTTIAKLAATYKLRQGKSVGLITSDTYRIAAVDQLRTYADIIGLPLKVALTPREMATARQSFADVDVILIDTAGRSQHDAERLDDLAAIIKAADPHETHLVLSGAASESVLMRAAERFGVVSPSRVIFTKLDETVNFGVIVNTAHRIGMSLSYVTTGQEVPDQIERGRPDRLARLVLEKSGTQGP